MKDQEIKSLPSGALVQAEGHYFLILKPVWERTDAFRRPMYTLICSGPKEVLYRPLNWEKAERVA